MCERYVAAGMTSSMLNRKCRHLSSRSHLRVCICYSFIPLFNEEIIKGQIKELVRGSVEETPTYCDFPSEHWTKIRTNNVIERMNRRTRAVGAFPNGNSALMLVCARLRHVAGTQWGGKKYMNMKHLETIEQNMIAG